MSSARTIRTTRAGKVIRISSVVVDYSVKRKFIIIIIMMQNSLRLICPTLFGVDDDQAELIPFPNKLLTLNINATCMSFKSSDYHTKGEGIRM